MTASVALLGVSARYGRITALDRLSLTVAAGSCHGIVGGPGAGKSTLLGLISGLVDTAGGAILLDGRPVTHEPAVRRAQFGIARTFHTPHPWHDLTVLDNVVLGSWRHAAAATRRWQPGRYREAADLAAFLLSRVGLAERAGTLTAFLTRGERRLLDLAVALAPAPRMLLLDEPTAGLAAADVQRLLPVIGDLASTTTVVVAERRLDTVASLASAVTVLAQGRIVATGAAGDVATHPALACAEQMPQQGAPGQKAS